MANMQEIVENQENSKNIKIPKVLVFDIETQRGFNEIKTISDMGVAVAVSCDCALDEYKIYTEENVQELIEEIFSADVVVGYNVINFDYKVLMGYTSRSFYPIKTIDMMQIVYRNLGFRPKLDNLVSATIGETKSADGLQSLRWYKQGRIDLIKEYCHKDVSLTKTLYEFGRDNGFVYCDNRGNKIKVLIEW